MRERARARAQSAAEEVCRAFPSPDSLSVTLSLSASFLDVVLVTRADMEEKNNDANDLRNKIGEIQVQSEYKLHLHEQDWHDKTKKMKEEMEAARSASEAR